MLFHSTFPENLKRQTIKREIGFINFDLYEKASLADIQKEIGAQAKKAGVSPEQIFFRREDVEVDPEYSRYEHRLIFYYTSPETDEEYNKRISTLEIKDLHDFLVVLAKFTSVILEKKKIKKLFDKHVTNGPCKGLVPDWQKEQLKAFFSDTHPAEKIEAAYKKGLAEGKKIGKESVLNNLKKLEL